MIKLILTDMDGTLLNSKKEMNPNIMEYMHKKSQEGFLFALASGRQYASLKETFNEIQDDLIFVAENGMYIVYQNQELFSKTMNKEEVLGFVKMARKIVNAYVVVCGKKSAYYEKENEIFYHEATRYYAKLKKIDSLDEILQMDDEVLKIAIWCQEGTETNIYPHYAHVQDYLVSVSAFDWMDIMPKGYNKGTAVQFLKKHFNISRDEICVFGDYLNDLEMMKEATFSYAMKNAHPSLLEVSNYVTEYTNEEDGVYKQLIQLLGE